MRRPTALLSLLLVAAVVGAACSSTLRPVAARVDGTEITRATLDADLRALVGNRALVQLVNRQLAQQGGGSLSEADGTVNVGISSRWLSSLLTQSVVDREFARRRLRITAGARTSARQSMEQSFGGAAVFAKFPGPFRTRLVERQARLDVVRGALQGPAAPSEAALRQFYDRFKGQLCPSGKLVAHILVATRPEADAIEAQLAQGADFAQLAKTKSIDTQSGAQGGELGCLGQAQFVTEFQQAADALEVGKVSAPVQTQFGFHVIRVTAFTFEGSRAAIEAAYQQRNGDPLATLVTKDLRKARIWVDPRYGKVQKSAQGVTIVPPAAPKPRNEPSKTKRPPKQAPATQPPTATQPPPTSGTAPPAP